MTSPLPLPDWVPWWVHVAILLGLALFALLFMLMPFSVLGVKTRLDTIDARLDEIQAEIRSLSLALADPMPPDPAYAEPARRFTDPRDRDQPAAPRIVRPPGRTEPRLY